LALIDCKFYSEALALSTSMTVILPQATKSQIGMQNVSSEGKHKTLFLLHGLSDDHTIWTRRTSIERYVAPLGIAVVMPAVHRSFYADMKYGLAYETFVAEELPGIVRSFFHLSEKREDNFIAGLSMGGYGAFKLALNYPQNYAAAASLSGVVDIASRAADAESWVRPDLINVFGTELAPGGTRNDVLAMLTKRKAENASIPRLYACCGENDGLYQQNVALRDLAKSLGVALSWQSDPGYEHTWDYWDMRIQSVLQWMLPDQIPGK